MIGICRAPPMCGGHRRRSLHQRLVSSAFRRELIVSVAPPLPVATQSNLSPQRSL